ncbi:hypothetical protein AAFF_G00228150 [Aldrovandia affinis]|uniref:Uncharacterized protein n=1 Tax=Aldrovandia affinis TaxID=143900 RepID=A0AAD7SV72_9TELE|nr:hypothetical protein AAFF_G00228150 [Aldrovandia affinis]
MVNHGSPHRLGYTGDVIYWIRSPWPRSLPPHLERKCTQHRRLVESACISPVRLINARDYTEKGTLRDHKDLPDAMELQFSLGAL